MGNENKQPKEKKEKVVIRKCHHCHKPLEEGKSFCLHCGHTYTEADPFAAEKKAKKKKILIKWLIRLAILVGIALVIMTAVLLILKEINKSHFLRITEFIKSEGEFVIGTPPEELEFASELEEASILESQRREEEKNKETESGTEGESESTEGGAGLVNSSTRDDESESELEVEDTEDDTASESTEIIDENRMVKIETLDRYVFKVNKTISLWCTEDDKTTFYLVYTNTVDNFYTKIILEICEDNKNDEYKWEALVSYDDPSPISSQYDFVREYHGTFDPSKVDLSANTSWIKVESKLLEDLEDEITDETTDEETESESEESSTRPVSSVTLIAKTESESESESEGESEDSSEDEENPDGEEGEDDVPQISIEEAIEKAALDMVGLQIRELIVSLREFIEDNQINATLDELGFTKLFNYYESLDPLKNVEFVK